MHVVPSALRNATSESSGWDIKLTQLGNPDVAVAGGKPAPIGLPRTSKQRVRYADGTPTTGETASLRNDDSNGLDPHDRLNGRYALGKATPVKWVFNPGRSTTSTSLSVRTNDANCVTAWSGCGRGRRRACRFRSRRSSGHCRDRRTACRVLPHRTAHRRRHRQTVCHCRCLR